MAKPIAIEFTSDTKAVIRGAGDIADAYDDVSDALLDVAKASDKSAGKVEDSAKDAARSLDRTGDAADDLERKMKDAFDGVSASARKSSKSVGDDTKKGFKEAEGGVKEFGEEANSTAKESAASFDGSAESILDSFQEVAANAFAGFGPAGAAAGLAVAVGMGIAISAMQDTADKATEAKQRAVDMVDSIKEAGGDLANMDLADKIISWGREVIEDNWITFWADESSTNFQEIAKHAKTMGINVSDAIRAASGSAEDSRRLLDATAQTYQDLNREIERGTSANEDGILVLDDSAAAAKRKRDALDQLRGKAEENIKVTGDAVDIYNIEKDAVGDTEEATRAATDALRDRASALQDSASAAMDIVSAENDWAEKLPQLTKDIAANGKTLDVNTEAGRANRESLNDLAATANTLRDNAIGAGEGVGQVTARVEASREAFINAAIAAGHSAGSAAALADSYGLIPGNVETLVKANGTEEAKAAIDSIPDATDSTVTVTETGATETQAAIDAVKGKEETVKVLEEGAANVQQTIDNLKGRDIPIRLTISNLFEFSSQVAAATAPRNQFINLVPREGQSVAP